MFAGVIERAGDRAQRWSSWSRSRMRPRWTTPGPVWIQRRGGQWE